MTQTLEQDANAEPSLPGPTPVGRFARPGSVFAQTKGEQL